MGKSAANKAAQQQSQSAQQAIDLNREIFRQQQANLSPYMAAGSESLAALMQSIREGKYGTGSTGAVPTFTAPTLEQARTDPGYEFTRSQGTRAVLQGAAAAGGAISGGTLRALDTFGSGLADTTYGNVFDRAMRTYTANLSGYQTDLARKSQEFNQAFAPVQLGENAVAGVNNAGSVMGANVGNLMTQQGNALAAGTVGGSNALASGIGGAAGGILNAVMMGNILKGGKAVPAPKTPEG